MMNDLKTFRYWLRIKGFHPKQFGTGTKWNPIRLKSQKNVIVLYKNGCIGKGKRIYVNEINKKGWQWSCLKGEDITHWMYFPY